VTNAELEKVLESLANTAIDATDRENIPGRDQVLHVHLMGIWSALFEIALRLPEPKKAEPHPDVEEDC